MRGILPVVMIFVCTASAEMSLGVDFHLGIGDLNDGDDPSVLVLPSLVIPTGTMEVVPRGGFAVNMRGLDFQLLAGCGLFFHLLEREPFGFSLGPQLTFPLGFGERGGEDFVRTGFELAMPVNVDLHVSDAMFVRMGFHAAEFVFEKDVDSPDNDERVGFLLETLASPWMGFYFYL